MKPFRARFEHKLRNRVMVYGLGEQDVAHILWTHDLALALADKNLIEGMEAWPDASVLELVDFEIGMYLDKCGIPRERMVS